MPITLYMEPVSPPSRAVMMTANAIGLNLEHKVIILEKGEHLKPEFLKINPQHTIPTLVDDGTVLWDSHAIIAYLVSKYGKDDSLYPKDLKKRAIVDQRLHFDSGTLSVARGSFVKKCMSRRGRTLEDYEKTAILDSFKLLEEFLKQTSYMAGDSLTIADLSIITSVTASGMIVPIDNKTFPKLSKWIETMELLPYYKKVNEEGLRDFKGLLTAVSDLYKS